MLVNIWHAGTIFIFRAFTNSEEWFEAKTYRQHKLKILFLSLLKIEYHCFPSSEWKELEITAQTIYMSEDEADMQTLWAYAQFVALSGPGSLQTTRNSGATDYPLDSRGLATVPQGLCSHTKLSVEVSCSDPSPAQQPCLLNIENPNTNLLLQAERITKREMSVN